MTEVFLLFEERELGHYGRYGGFSSIRGIYSSEEKTMGIKKKHGDYPTIMTIELDKEVDITNDD
jgi:hypothetical protein